MEHHQANARRRLAGLVVAAAAVGAAIFLAIRWAVPDSEAGTAARAFTVAPCERPAIAGRVECGTMDVPENREKPDGRSISIFALVARATGQAADEPVFFFTGGPGSAATASAGALSSELESLRATRDFVFMDQRGTGQSAPLPCEFPSDIGRRLAPMFDPGETARCREMLTARADLLSYTTADAVRDADDLRRALGYASINVHGSSYGTRTAWQYAARFPAHTRSMVLHGPAPPGFYLPMPFARGLEAALAGVVADCLDDAPCAARFPELRRDLERAFDQVRAAPARVTIARAGAPDVGGEFGAGELAEAIRYQLYSAAGASRVPSMIAAAAAGDYSRVAQASVENRLRLERQLNRGMFLSVTCAEDVPFMTEAAIGDASAGTRLGDYRVRQQIAACREWPRATRRFWSRGPANPAQAPALHVPALVQVGQFDPATPLEWAERAMKLLPNGRLVVVPHGAHALYSLGLDDCLPQLAAQFIARGSAQRLDTSCIAQARRPPFDLR